MPLKNIHRFLHQIYFLKKRKVLEVLFNMPSNRDFFTVHAPAFLLSFAGEFFCLPTIGRFHTSQNRRDIKK